jgi:F-type H+-transporting ATPase subunit delta
MAELSTIARPYAEALFRVAKDGNLAQTAQALSGLAALAAQPEVLALIGNPNLSSAQLLDVFGALANKQVGALDASLNNFIQVLVENDRLALLPQIASQFIELRHAHEGTAEAQITSAYPIEGAQLTDLLSALEKKFGVKLQAQVVVDPSLIGGVRVLVGDRELDTSVRARLNQMATVLTA